MKPKILLIVAAARQRIIGNVNNEIPWPRVKRDMQHFRTNTLANPVIMGRVTFETLPKKDGFIAPLPNRQNIIVTRNSDYVAPPEAWIANSIEAAIEQAKLLKTPRICIIGGQQIYEATINMADEILYTDIHLDVEGTTTFPPIPDGFILDNTETATEEVKFPDDSKASVTMEFQKWVRKQD